MNDNLPCAYFYFGYLLIFSFSYLFFLFFISSFDYSSLILLQNNHFWKKKVFFSHWKVNIAYYLVTIAIQVNYRFLVWSHFYSFSFLSLTCCFG